MKIVRLSVDAFEFTTILDFTYHKTVNDHTYCLLTGYIDEKAESEYIKSSLKEKRVTITGFDDNGESEIIMCGILYELQIKSENGLKKLTIEVVSATKLMDLKERSRTFQDGNMQYDELLSHVLSSYEKSGHIMTVGESASLEKLIVQYKETDWDFCKRLASHFTSILVPASKFPGIRFYVGIPQKTTKKRLDPIFYEMRKEVGGYLYKNENNVSAITENDEIYYIVQDRNFWDIGEPVSFQGQNLFVHEINAMWEGGELLCTVTLKNQAGFKIPKLYNEKLIGASLDGNIIDVMNDVVKVHLSVDDKQDISCAKWFDYSTVYSSPDGTGWYAMPENNDEIRLYFPTEKEKHAYVISAVHVDENDAQTRGYRTNPDDKSIKTKYNKEVLMQPTRIFITNNAGLEILMDDEQGISISSELDVNITAKNQIGITSLEGSIEIIAAQGITVKQGDAAIKLQESELLTSGSQVRFEKV